MSDVDIIISEMDDLKSKVDIRKVEICKMEKRIEELDELLGVSEFDDEGMGVESLSCRYNIIVGWRDNSFLKLL